MAMTQAQRIQARQSVQDSFGHLTKPEQYQIITSIETVLEGKTSLTSVDGASFRTQLATDDASVSAKVTDAELDHWIAAVYPFWKGVA